MLEFGLLWDALAVQERAIQTKVADVPAIIFAIDLGVEAGRMFASQNDGIVAAAADTASSDRAGAAARGDAERRPRRRSRRGGLKNLADP